MTVYCDTSLWSCWKCMGFIQFIQIPRFHRGHLATLAPHRCLTTLEKPPRRWLSWPQGLTAGCTCDVASKPELVADAPEGPKVASVPKDYALPMFREWCSVDEGGWFRASWSFSCKEKRILLKFCEKHPWQDVQDVVRPFGKEMHLRSTSDINQILEVSKGCT